MEQIKEHFSLYKIEYFKEYDYTVGDLYDTEHNISIRFYLYDNYYYYNGHNIIQNISEKLNFMIMAYNYITNHSVKLERNGYNILSHNKYNIEIGESMIFITITDWPSLVIRCQPEEIYKHCPDLIKKEVLYKPVL